MKRMSYGWIVVASVMWVTVLASIAGAQTAAAPPAPAAPAAANPAANQAPPVAFSTLVERNGGSLARAQVADEDPSATEAPSVSYTAVPSAKPKLLRKHDLVTIVVREESQFSSNGTTNTKHSADLDSVIDSYVSLSMKSLGATGLVEHSPATPIELKTNSVRDFDGEATVNRADTFTASITATVIDVKPNGTLVLEARQSIKTDEELQTMRLVGTCRVEDVAADNSVLSTQLYDLSLDKQHSGAVKDTTTRGLIPRLLDKLNPF